MESYEEFCKNQFARIQGEAIHPEPVPADPQRVSLIHFHGVAVLSPLLTVEKRQEMQKYRQKAIELDDKRLNSKKRSLLNRVQEILDTVQVKTIQSFLPNTESETEQSSGSKSMNGFTILPNAINLPMFSSENGPAKYEKSLENVISSPVKQLKSFDTRECIDCMPLMQSKSPLTDSQKADITEDAVNSVSQDELTATAKEAPDPYVMSLQNLLKKSREYIEREQSRRSLKNSSKGGSMESHSDKENDVIKISDSLKEKARIASRSRSCSPLMVDKPSLNKSNTLLQAASNQSNNSTAHFLPTFSKVDTFLRPETSSGADTESDEELKRACMLELDSSIVKSLTGSYSKLPSPEPSLSPKMHRRRPRPLSAGNIVINHPVNAYDLSPKDKGKIQESAHPEKPEETSPFYLVPNLEGPSASISSMKRHSFSENVELRPSLSRPSRSTLLGCKVNQNNGIVNTRTDTDNPHTPPCRAENTPFQHTDTASTDVDSAHKPYFHLEVKRNSPAELNKSYDVETPSPILMQSQSTNQVTDTPNVSTTREQLMSSQFDIQVKRRLELDLESTQRETSPPSVEEKPWLHERSRSASLHIPKREPSPNSTFEDSLKKKMLAFEELRKKLEEQHAYQLSLLIAEQEREQERLQREFKEEERRIRFKEPSMVVLEDDYRAKPNWSHRSESRDSESMTHHLDNDHSVNTAEPVFIPSQHGYGSTNEPMFNLWGPAEMRAPKISASRPMSRGTTRWSQVYSPHMQRKLCKVTAFAKGFLTRKLMQTEKLKYLKQTVKDTAEFIKTFHSDVPLTRGMVSAQDVSLQERVIAQLRAALYEIHDIFFTISPVERVSILAHDRELRRDKMIRQLEKTKSPRDRVTLSSATQKSLDRKKLTRAVEIGMSNRKPIAKPKMAETRVLQPSQGLNAPINKLLCRQGSICKKNSKKEAKCCDNLRRQHSLG
ncbi:centriolar coiled-coil protein of 110 kDa [Hyperolius riggenbachi]|uniref:centriolar coiled-coil protein of 110 kDa n=1 Tax=Hyperolius riggenbachi TaxID=752182 RepID=UPI0035A36220